MRLQPPDRRTQLVGVGHVDHQRLVGHAVRGRIGIPLDGDHVRAEPLQGDRQLAAELSGPQQHDLGPVGRRRRRLA